MSGRSARSIRNFCLEVSPDLVLPDIRKYIFNVLLPEEEGDLVLREEDDFLLELHFSGKITVNGFSQNVHRLK